MDFTKTKLYNLSNKKYLSELLRIEVAKLKDIEAYFNTEPFDLTTNKGKKRTIYNPDLEYKQILVRLNKYLQLIQPPKYVFGGIKQRNYLMNAQLHSSNNYFLLLDLKNFFPSTRDSFVFSFFNKKLNMSVDIAKICTLLTTEVSPDSKLTRHLPQGYPTSPYLSFLAYYDLYNGLEKLAVNNELVFSSYYDDITFSAQTPINKSFKKKVSTIINEYGLSINDSKSKLVKNNGLKITGAYLKDNIIKAPSELHLKMFKEFEALNKAFYVENTDLQLLLEHCNRLEGYLAAIKMLENQKDFIFINSRVKEVRNYIKATIS